ncbi:MAG: 3-dehydroquinate synthase [Alphaproteobacteria bacterium]|nr:3-dehydroquinate synthase [Alphaproteobacteria bacterium]
MTQATSLRVDLDARAYDIVVGDDLVATAGARMAGVLAQPRVLIVTDSNVAPLYLKTLEASLDAENIEHASIVLPAGEATKDHEHLNQLTDWLLGQRIERATSVVALGGGVIGDIAGFAASMVLRGVNVVQIPTTLLAQVDSSVGGKTGINSHHGKNLLGSFHQPILVLADMGTLETLPRRQLLAGYGETVKYGLIEDADFFEWLDTNGQAFCDGDREIRRTAVLRACEAKALVVAEDEKETARRALLNFGHTFGHAFEAETGYGDELFHGEAVAIGMAVATDLSVRLGLCPPEDARRTRAHMDKLGLPTGLGGIAKAHWNADRLLAHMMSDKKVQSKRPTFILTRGIGKAFTTQDVDAPVLHDFLSEILQPLATPESAK